MKIFTENEYKRLVESAKRAGRDSMARDLVDIDSARSQTDVVVEFNIPGIRIVSVERMYHNTSEEVTVIGYFKEPNNTYDESKYECSRAQHNKLAQQFLGLSKGGKTALAPEEKKKK